MAKKAPNLYLTSGRHSVLFFIFVIAGSVLLYLAKASNLPPLIIVACSFGMMAAYAIFILAIPATKLRLDVAADNMYYLGFLYTLSSLAVAITVDEPEKVLANFGVAITCTIIGIAFRVALNQLRIDPYDVEAASRLELSQATKRVSRELDQSIKELIKFRTMSMQVMAEGYEDVQKNVDGAGKNMFASLKETSDKNSEILVEMAKQSNSAQENLSETIALLKDSNKEIVLANKSMLNQISKTSVALQELAEKYSDTNAIEDRVVGEIKTGMNGLQKEILDENQRSSNEVKSGMSNLHSKILDETQRNSDEVKSGMSELHTKILDENQRSSNEVKSGMNELRSRILDENLKNSNDAKNEMNELQSKIINVNNKNLNEFKASMSELQSKVLDENNKNMDHLYARSEKILNKLEKAKRPEKEEPTERDGSRFLPRFFRRNK